LELFRAKGIEAYPGQLLRGCAEERISHWRRKWDAIPTAFNWIGTRVVYHEVSVVRTEADQARIYDPTEGFWLEPGARRGRRAVPTAPARFAPRSPCPSSGATTSWSMADGRPPGWPPRPVDET